MGINARNVRPIPNRIRMAVNVFVRKDIIKHPLAHAIHVLMLGMPRQPRKPVINVLKTPVCGVHIKAIIIVSIVIMPQVHMLGLPKKNVTIVRTGISKTVAVHCVQRVNSPMQTERIVNNTKKSPKIGDFILWRARQDSNLQPSDP